MIILVRNKGTKFKFVRIEVVNSRENMPNQAEKPNRNGNNATAIKT